VQLQAVSLDTAKAVELVHNLIECLTTFRLSDDFGNNLFAQAEKQSIDCDIAVNFCDNLRRPRKLSRALNDSVVFDTVGQRTDVDSNTGFKHNVF